MKLLNSSKSKTRLEYFILKILNEKYSNAFEIEKNLNEFKIEYERKDLYPVLSHLLLNNYLCYNWINESGNEIKYYHITPIGKIIIKKDD
ncbi:MAG: helix-turn-helix transcriptional regulator [Bacteroidales bacterium]|nr:helix-turn-helix transcriptional regulator [Bacteroidales bacterium]MBN2756118.1 helix-turn-helix transcriptional regulator [Bacteroidales bacterium]